MPSITPAGWATIGRRGAPGVRCRAVPGDRDAQGRRKTLTGWETALWYGLAGVTYIGASTFEKGLLNWLIGPAWLVAIVWGGPALVDRLRGRPAPAPGDAA